MELGEKKISPLDYTTGNGVGVTASTLRLITALHVVLSASCSLGLDADRVQCTTDQDCREAGEPLSDGVCERSWCTRPAKWSCLDAPTTLGDGSSPFLVTMRLRDILTQQPLPDVRAQLCQRSDPECMRPVSEAALSDEDGVVRLAISPEDPELGFSGFVLFEHDDLMPSMYFVSPPLDRAVEIPSVQLLTRDDASLVAQQLDTDLEPERGLVLVSALDCESQPASGVSLVAEDTDDVSHRFYSVSGLPVATASETDHSGYAGLLNVQPGPIVVSGRVTETRRLLGTTSLRVRAGAITYCRMSPYGL